MYPVGVSYKSIDFLLPGKEGSRKMDFPTKLADILNSTLYWIKSTRIQVSKSTSFILIKFSINPTNYIMIWIEDMSVIFSVIQDPEWITISGLNWQSLLLALKCTLKIASLAKSYLSDADYHTGKDKNLTGSTANRLQIKLYTVSHLNPCLQWFLVRLFY